MVVRVKGFTYYVKMNVTLSLDDRLVKEVRKIAIDRDTTLTSLVREYLEKLAAENAASGRKRRELEALERSFKQFHRKLDFGKRTWKRQDRYDRS
jgi:DNA-binding GntR family transcriptional regulator